MEDALNYLTESAKSSAVLNTILNNSFGRSIALKTALGLYFLHVLLKYRDNAVGSRRVNLPGPKGLPLVGNVLLFVNTPMTQLSQMHDAFHEKYGPAWTYSLPGLGRVFMVNDPQVLEHVVKTNFWAYEKGPMVREALGDLLGAGIFGADGEHWEWQRKIASRIFNVRDFRDYTSNVFVQQSKMVADYFDKFAQNGTVVDVQDIALKFTLDSFGEVSFGQSFGCLVNPEEKIEFAAAYDRLNAAISERLFKGPWRLVEWLTGLDKKIAKDKKIIVDYSYEIIRKRRTEGYHNPEKDLLQFFVDFKDNNDEPLSDDMIKDTILNFITAGRDTTAQALSWMFYLLHKSSTDKSVVRKLQEEIDSVLGEGMPSYDASKKMKYAEACLYEALRLFPSIPRNMKVCVEDDVLPNGIEIKKGECFQWSAWTMGRDTVIWGPDAKEFNPERWMTGEKFSPTMFPAFHAGPRACLGQQFATIEAITFMSVVLQRFEFELVDPDHEPAYGVGLGLPLAQGLPMRVRRRGSSALAV